MSTRLERILRLDSLIRYQPGLTAKDIAKKLEVSERTVFYDLAYLKDRLGAPIVLKDNGYAYQNSSWKLPDEPLTQGEVFALLLGKQMLDQYYGNAFETELRAAIESLTKRLPEKTKTKLHELSDAYQFSAGAKVDISPLVWSELNRALLEQKQIHLNYIGMVENHETKRTVDPYLLYDVRGSQYLIGYCHLRKNIRSFRLNRIKTIQVLDNGYKKKTDFDAKQYLNQTFQIEVVHEPTEVEILFYPDAAKYIRERVWHPSQESIEHENGALTLKMTVVSIGEVKRWVLTWGAHARVIKPQELISEVRQEISELSVLYNQADFDLFCLKHVQPKP